MPSVRNVWWSIVLFASSSSSSSSSTVWGMRGSVVTQKLLSLSRRLDNDNNQYYGLASKSLKYLGCSDGGYRQDQNYYYNQENNDENDNGNLVRFTLCDDCDNSCTGEYAVGMAEFLNIYAETVQEEQEQQCGYVAQHCYCNDGSSWDYCLWKCYQNAGMSECMNSNGGNNGGNNGGGENQFELREYMECREAYGGNGDGNNNNNNNNNNGNNNYNNGNYYQKQQFYVGPICGQDSNIYLAAFNDEYCSYQADASEFQSLNYGSGFPYMDSPLLSSSSTCLTCMDNGDDNNNQNNQQQNYNGYNNGNYYEEGNNNNNYYNYNAEPNELCQKSTEEAMFICDPDRGYSSGCYFLNTTLPCYDGRGCPAEVENDDQDVAGGDNVWSSSATQMDINTLLENDAVWIGGAAVTAFLVLGVAVCCCCRPKSRAACLKKDQKSSPLLSFEEAEDHIELDRSVA